MVFINFKVRAVGWEFQDVDENSKLKISFQSCRWEFKALAKTLKEVDGREFQVVGYHSGHSDINIIFHSFWQAFKTEYKTIELHISIQNCNCGIECSR